MTRKPVLDDNGRTAPDAPDAPVEVARQGDGFLVTVGRTSIWVAPATAEEMLVQLQDALTADFVKRLVAAASSS